MVDRVTAVSNRPQSFPLSLSHRSAVSFNLDKNRAPTIYPTMPPDTPVSPPSVIGLSSCSACTGKGVTLFQTHWPTHSGGDSQEMVCDAFLLFYPPSQSAVNKRDLTASLLLWLRPTWVDFHVFGQGDKLQFPETLSKCLDHVKGCIEHVAVR